MTELKTPITGKPITTVAPNYARPIWREGLLTNKHEAPLWSGKGELPAVGAYVDISGPKNEVATVLGYFIDDGWLMLWCERHSDGRRGDLAGTEIR